MITLSLKENGAFLGTIDEADLQLLQDQLEEESEEDTDYYIDAPTIDLLEAAGAGAQLLSLLRRAMDDSEGVEVVWRQT